LPSFFFALLSPALLMTVSTLNHATASFGGGKRPPERFSGLFAWVHLWVAVVLR